MKPPSFIGGGIGMKLCPTATTTAKDNIGGETTCSTDTDADTDAVDVDAPPDTHTHCKTFQIVYSAEFARLHEQYTMIANSGDVNRLAVFLSQHPYHPEGVCCNTLCCAVIHYAVL
jgi:hypothetical protein